MILIMTRLNTTIKLLTILFLCLFLSSFVLAQKEKYEEWNGVKFEIRNDSISFVDDLMSITFYKDGHYVYKRHVCDICMSHVETPVKSFGKFIRYKNKAYYLFAESPHSSEGIFVSEQIHQTTDTISIIVQSPIEQRIKENSALRDMIFYQIRLEYDIDTIKKYNQLNANSWIIDIFRRYYSPYYTFWSNNIKIPKLINLPVKAIIIKIYPTENADNITCPYVEYEHVLYNQNATDFEVTLPNLLYQNFCFEDFFYKEVLILNKTTIEIDNFFLYKKSYPHKTVRNWRVRAFKYMRQKRQGIYEEMEEW